MLRTALLLTVSILAVLVASMPAVAQWIEFGKLTASDAAAGDVFGGIDGGVAISGNTAIVGAFQSDDAGDRSGSAYLFNVTTGNQLYKRTGSDGTSGTGSGGPSPLAATRPSSGHTRTTTQVTVPARRICST